MNISAFMTARALAAVTLFVACAGAVGQAAPTAATPEPVVAVVRVAKPWYAPRSLVVSRMRETIEQYARLPGLDLKAFTLERESGDYGGVYFWKDRPSAQAYFDDAWHARVRRERGVQGRVTLYDAPVSIDNVHGGVAANSDSSAVVTVVQFPLPPEVDRARVIAGFHAAVEQYRVVPGLLRKHFVLGPNATFGGIYLWKDEASARAFFDDAWTDRVRGAWHAEPRIERFDAPILLPSADAANRVEASRLVALPR